MASIDSGHAISKEPAYRLHETGTQSALGMLFPIFGSSQFVEEFRRTSEARDFDRLIAG
jgi:hypothetical protein